jgi:glutamine amidotransferase
MITIIDYQVGNLNSIKNMLKKIGYRDAVISDRREDIARADHLILPGVGAFHYGMERLKASDYFELLNHRVLEEKVPVLGICLGAQLLTEHSEEGDAEGLGWIKGRTVKFDPQQLDTQLKIPHMGWCDVTIKKDHPLTEGLEEMEPRFYFVHSYHILCDRQEDVLLTGRHGHEFVAGVAHDNILGVQFHPEKSHKFGMHLLKNFIQRVPWKEGSPTY